MGLRVFVEGILKLKVGSSSQFVYFKIVNTVYGLWMVETVVISGYAPYEMYWRRS